MTALPLHRPLTASQRFWLAAALLMAADALVGRGLHQFDRHPVLAIGQLADCVLAIPLLYLFFHRGQARSPWALLKAALLGASLAWLIIPAGILPEISLMKQGLLVLQAGIEGWLVWRVARLIAALSRQRSASPEAAIRSACTQVLGTGLAARALSVELLSWYLALFSWRRQTPIVTDGHAFGYGQRDGSAAVWLGLAFMQWLEPPFLHLIIAIWSKPVAWLFTGLSVYGFFFLLANYRATRLRPVTLDNTTLYIRCGLLGDVDLPREAIKAVSRHSGHVNKRAPGVLLRVGPLAEPNLCITLHRAQPLPRPLGRSKIVDMVYLSLDEPQSFIAAFAPLPTAGQ